MPTYDGIGSSITHRVEVVGDSLFQDVDGGTLSTKVPVQIFSNYYASPGSVDSSRQLRFRVQPDGESNVSNSYVTDMGVKGADGSNYFFITAPQNTSNVGDQNTFVISTASNVGIGTTDPVTTLQVVGDIKCQTLTASNIVGGSPLTISADSISINAPVTMPADAPMEIGTMTVSNIFHSDQLTMSAHVAMGSDKTLTTSNLVANTGDNLLISSNLEVGTSNLFVDTTTGRVGIGTNSPGKKLTIYDTNPFTELRASTEGHGSTLLLGTPYSATSPSKVGIIAQGISNFSRAKLHFCLDDNSSNDPAYAASVSNSRMTIQPNGNVGIGVTNPSAKLDVAGKVIIYDGSWGGPGNGTTGSSGTRLVLWPGGENSTPYALGIDASTLWYGSQSIHKWYVGTSEKMRIDSSGNVGIGTSPFSKLTIGSSASGNGNIDEIAFRSINNSAINRVGYTQRISFYCRQEYNNNNRLSAAIACYYAGNVHYPNYPGNSSTNLYFYTTNTYGNYYERFRIDSEGRIYVTGSVVHGSDDRIKINEERMTNATETLMKLDPQIYDKTSNIYSSDVVTREAGLIIQDIWYDAPELRYIIDLAEDANPPEERPPKSDNIQEDPDYSTWGSKVNHLNYTSLIPYLIKSNQEQQALIEDLRARIEALENSS